MSPHVLPTTMHTCGYIIIDIHTSIIHTDKLTDLFKVNFLLLGIGVIEPHNEFATECQLVILVEQGSLSMADMQVPTNKQTNKQT